MGRGSRKRAKRRGRVGRAPGRSSYRTIAISADIVAETFSYLNRHQLDTKIQYVNKRFYRIVCQYFSQRPHLVLETADFSLPYVRDKNTVPASKRIEIPENRFAANHILSGMPIVYAVPSYLRIQETVVEYSPEVFIWWTMAFLILHNSCLFLVQIWHQTLYYKHREPCDLTMVTWQCLLLRIPTISSIISMSGIHLFMLIDQLHESHFPHSHNTLTRTVGVYGKAAVFLAFFTTVITVYIFYTEDFHSNKFYCVASSQQINFRLIFVYKFLFLVDLFCTIGFSALLRQGFRRLKGNEHKFVLGRKVEMRSNVAALRFMIASTFLRSIFFGTFLAANFLTRMFIQFDNFILLARVLDSLYIVQWYGCALALLLFRWRIFLVPHAHVIHVDEQNRLHFTHLRTFWDEKMSERKTSLAELSHRSDYENFLDLQIAKLLADERRRNQKLERLDELAIAIEFCKKFLLDFSQAKSKSGHEEGRKKDVMAKLVELNLEVELIKEFQSAQSNIAPIRKVRGHEFVAQAAAGRNPYCEVCLSAIWRLAQAWRRCNICGFRAHDKCVEDVRRPCVSILLARQSLDASVMPCPLSFEICPETTLPAQNYQCEECHAPIGFDEGTELEARLCDYSGNYYCRRCHWNDEMVIPARLVHNWDVERRPVCRASKQMLAALERRPLIDLRAQNPALFRYVNALRKISELRKAILFMKCYFVSCKSARKLRILQYLNRYQHFVDTDTMYTMEDLIKLSSGKLLPEIETIVEIFHAHITKDCEICQGNAFICELCDAKEPIYPFSAGVSLCKECGCVFHRVCYERVSRRCSRCSRRKARKASSVIVDDVEDDGDKSSVTNSFPHEGNAKSGKEPKKTGEEAEIAAEADIVDKF